MATDDLRIIELLRSLEWALCRRLAEDVSKKSAGELSAVVREGEDDTIYGIDLDTENFIVDYFEKHIAREVPCVLIAEGLPPEGVVFTPSGRAGDAEYTIIMDPLDGTRGLMYKKRSAWVLAGAARGAGPGLTLADVVGAVQTEIPPPKQCCADQLYAAAGGGAKGEIRDLRSGASKNFLPRPSESSELQYGFVTFSRFFPGAKDLIMDIETELCRRFETRGEKTFYFEDQYICSGGQLAELACGRDRFCCDLRAALSGAVLARSGSPPLCVHPYDVCTELIAREAGVVVTDEKGGRLSAPLDTTTDVSWIGYANRDIREMIEKDLLDIIFSHCGH